MRDQHLTVDDMPLFTRLRMTAFGEAVIDIANDPTFDEWTFSQKVRHALERETAARGERRMLKLLKASRTPNPAACVEDIHYLAGRSINRLFRFWSAWGCDCVGVVRPGVGEPWVENGDVKSAISTPKAHHEIYLFFLSCGRRDLSYHRTWPDDRGRIHRRG